MSPTEAGRWERIQEILADALELEGAERARYLEGVCAGEPELRAEVDSLIEASEQADAYFTDLADRAGITLGPDGAPPQEEEPEMQGRRVGAYRLGTLLGRGGMGAVYTAERADGQFELTAALKLLPVGAATPAAHRRFLEERRILARLEHPNIARLYDGGVTEDGTPYFVMEYVKGLPLTEFCRRREMGFEERLRLFLNVCDAVSFAHRKLVVHRDLKPNNVLVTAEGQVKLLDFGIARLMEPGEGTLTATALGGRLMTPRYASPEQLKGEPVTTASDVYALGVILHELLTGVSPYDMTGDTTSWMEAICRHPVPVPSHRIGRWAKASSEITPEMRDVITTANAMGLSVRALARRLSGDLDNILLVTLRKETDRRYASVEALSDDIRRHLDGFPVKARPEGFAYVASRFLTRNALAVAAAAAFVVLTGTLLVLLLRFTLTTREQSLTIARERDRAEEIAHFMRELFEVANPELTSGETLTARELLDRGAEKIREDHPDEPELQAEMMTVLGTVYRHLGIEDPAVELLRQARDLHRQLGNVHPDARATTLLELGRALRDRGDVEEAAAVLRDARDGLRASRGNQDPEVALATLELGGALHRLGDAGAAQRELLQGVSMFRTLRLDPGEEYAEALFLLGESLSAQERTAEAMPLYEESLQLVETLHGRDDPDVPPILIGMAGALRGGVPDSATALLRRALDIDRRLYADVDGGNHPLVARSLYTLGRHLATQGHPDEAAADLRRAIRMLERTTRPHPDLLGGALSALAGVLSDQGSTADALATYARGAAVLREAYGAGSLAEADVQVPWADLLLRLGRHGDAAGILEEALAAYGAALPPDHPRVLAAADLLGRARGGGAPR